MQKHKVNLPLPVKKVWCLCIRSSLELFRAGRKKHSIIPQYIYCRYQCTTHGLVIFSGMIKRSDSDPKINHYGLQRAIYLKVDSSLHILSVDRCETCAFYQCSGSVTFSFFSSVAFKTPTKDCLAYYTYIYVHLHHSSKIKKIIKSQRSRNQRFGDGRIRIQKA